MEHGNVVQIDRARARSIPLASLQKPLPGRWRAAYRLANAIGGHRHAVDRLQAVRGWRQAVIEALEVQP